MTDGPDYLYELQSIMNIQSISKSFFKVKNGVVLNSQD